MRDEDDALTRLLADAQQLVLHTLASHLVEGTEGLVHEQERRVDSEGPRDRDALLHAAREFPGAVGREIGELDHLEQFGGTRLALVLRPALQLERQLDIALDRAPVEECCLLEGHAVALLLAGLGRRHARNLDRSLGGMSEIGDHAQQGALAAPGWTDERDELAARDGEVDVLKGGHLIGLSLVEDLPDTGCLDRKLTGCGRGHAGPSLGRLRVR